MAALPYMPLYVADYLADTAHLTALEHGAYLMLIMNYWQRGKSLPDDDMKLSRIARVDAADWPSVRASVEEFFDIIDGEWRHGRIEAELANVYSKSLKAKAARACVGKSRATDVERTSDERATDVWRPFDHTDTDTDTEQNKNIPTPVGVGAEAPEPPNARQILFDEGVSTLVMRGIAEKHARSLIGQLLRDCDDDAERVLNAIRMSRDKADPAGWLQAGRKAINSRKGTKDGKRAELIDALREASLDREDFIDCDYQVDGPRRMLA